MTASGASRAAIRLIVPGNVRHNSGGNAYNSALTRGLTALGTDVENCPVDGHWPVGREEERRRLAGLLLGDGGATSPAPSTARVTIVDGLVALGAPEALEAAAAAGRPAWILVHMTLPGHADREGMALAAAAGVICASSTAAAELRGRHSSAERSPARIHVALPGTSAAALAAGSSPPHLIAVAALLPNKDQLLLLEALAGIRDLPWTASLVGSDSADPAYAESVRGAVIRLGLTERVSVPGELSGPTLDAEWGRADLSLLISRTEAYGMVVTESLARGIPVVVRDGTGAVEALAAGSPGGSEAPDDGGPPNLPGAAVVLGADPAPLEAALRTWLTDPGLRSRWRDTALAARTRLPGWDFTARTVLDAIAASGPAN
ncbi:glycosyltransferase family 4 protein [Arthrobacter sp. Leaf337]|uniref:glycosyltransferase family 4 protein n=1 Tax=Arthrobacter sp. Leaf337 TaxID=1736342 RepID=UPI0009E80EE4|nr:glycosyltransferase family 4 protein [Arthrobacter sp. Leaf337]